MIEAVILFAVLTAILELVILAKLSPRTRLRVLNWPSTISAVAFTLNLIIHWGTMTGSMTAVVAALASIVVTAGARKYWGWINGSRYYHGIHKFTVPEIR